MNLIAIELLAILIFVCVFAIVDRICRCFETCHTAKAFEKFMENGGEKPEDLG